MRPDIDQLILTLKRGKASYVPHMELGIHPHIKQRFIGRPIATLADDIEFWHKAGYDYTKLQPGVDFNPAKIGAGKKALTFSQDGTVDRTWASESQGIVTTDQEFESYVFPKTSDFEYTKFEQVRALLPEGMGVIGQYGDIFTMTWEMMGLETFSMALFENPDLVERLNTTLGNLVLSMFEYFAQSDAVDAIWYSDDIAYVNSLLVSPEVLDQYFFPWLKKIGDLAHAANKPLIYHTDGILYDVFDRIIDCGVDAIHPIEPKAMPIAEVKKRYGDKLCLIGHVDVDMLSRGTEAEVREQVRKNIEEAGYNGGYCAGSGNSIPDYVKYENYLAMLRAVEDFGGV
jgi:uroporphyrinogen decarboxylase